MEVISMGRTITPKYAVEVKHGLTIQSTPSAWKGKPTAARLAQWVADYNESLKPGGANAHLTERWPIEACRITSARILLNDGSRTEVVAVTSLPPFDFPRTTEMKQRAAELQENREAQSRTFQSQLNEKFSQWLNALEEHKSEAERNDNPLMAEIYGEVLQGLYESKGFNKNGSVTININLAKGL
jgi:hypothetical protein